MNKLCIFDLDGTLINTLPQIDYYVNLTLEKFSLPKIDRETVCSFVGWGGRALIKKVLDYADSGQSISRGAFYDSYIRDYNSDVSYLAEVYGGVEAVLAELKALGVKLAVLSNKPHSTVSEVTRKFFPRVFDAVLGGREDYPLKPNPVCCFELCRLFDVGAESVLFFGDSEIDMKTASAMGAAKGVGVLWGFRSREVLKEAGADILIDSPSEIVDLVKKELKI